MPSISELTKEKYGNAVFVRATKPGLGAEVANPNLSLAL
jgi:hypothetical protein